MATSNSTDSCIACKFFITGGQLGSCHRYPQSLTKAPSEWCGEFIERIKALEFIPHKIKLDIKSNQDAKIKGKKK